MTVYIREVMGDRYGSVDDADRERAIAAAEAVLAEAGIVAREAQDEYERQWLEYDEESPMTGSARVWCQARDAASVALTSTWAKRGTVLCEIAAR